MDSISAAIKRCLKETVSLGTLDSTDPMFDKRLLLKSMHEEKNMFGRLSDWFIWKFSNLDCLQAEWNVCDRVWGIYRAYYWSKKSDRNRAMRSAFKVINGRLCRKEKKINPYITYTYYYIPTCPVKYITANFSISSDVSVTAEVK